MIGRVIGGGVLLAITFAVAWLSPQLARAPSDFEIAVDYLNRERPDRALLFLEDKTWRGVAAYRAGRFAQASREFSDDDRVLSLYNLGNSYAQLKDWPNAINTYQRVLRFDPEHADALHNLALVQQASAPKLAQLPQQELPEYPEPGEQEDQRPIPQESDPEPTQSGESEQSDKAGNTSDTEEIGEIDEEKRPKPIDTAGETGSAGAVGDTSEDRGGDNNQIVGTVDLKPRNSTRPAEMLLRKIHDDPEKVLRARLLSAYESRIAGAIE
ncbi:MAG: tetratricopeptide repeat protein [Geminicoccaceae bacterium]